ALSAPPASPPRARSRPRGRAGTASGTRGAARRWCDTELRSLLLRVDAAQLLTDERHRSCEPLAVCGVVEPAAGAGRVGERDDGRPLELVPLTDARGQRAEPEQPPQREAADGDDQARPQQLELPIAPEGAELLLPRRRRPVAAARRSAARVAARDR